MVLSDMQISATTPLFSWSSFASYWTVSSWSRYSSIRSILVCWCNGRTRSTMNSGCFFQWRGGNRCRFVDQNVSSSILWNKKNLMFFICLYRYVWVHNTSIPYMIKRSAHKRVVKYSDSPLLIRRIRFEEVSQRVGLKHRMHEICQATQFHSPGKWLKIPTISRWSFEEELTMQGTIKSGSHA